MSELKPEVASILAVIPHLATKADLAIIPHLATKADVAAVMTNVAKLESAIIKWIIATGLTSTALAFTMAKFLH